MTHQFLRAVAHELLDARSLMIRHGFARTVAMIMIVAQGFRGGNRSLMIVPKRRSAIAYIGAELLILRHGHRRSCAQGPQYIVLCWIIQCSPGTHVPAPKDRSARVV